MYTIISGTNRTGSYTERVAKEYQRFLKEINIDAAFFSLKDINPMKRDENFLRIENEVLIPTEKFIFIIPEYNGSYPGVLKTMIDNSDIRKVWHYKKTLLCGVSVGRAGNLRGMDHLSDTLHYLRMHVHYNKLPISVIDKIMDGEGHLDGETSRVIKVQLQEFINY